MEDHDAPIELGENVDLFNKDQIIDRSGVRDNDHSVERSPEFGIFCRFERTAIADLRSF
jgi:hypothetical protein